ncbi:MAG: cytochrome c [Myxococcota bacterium]
MKTMKSLLLGSASALGVMFGAGAVMASPDVRADDAPPTPAFEVKTAYTDTCAKCHGEDGKGQTKLGDKVRKDGKTMPDLTAPKADPSKFEGIISNGVADTAMKGYAKKFTPEQVTALANYSKAFKH